MFSLGTSGFTKSLNGVITRGLFSLCWCVGVVFSVAFAVVCLYIFSLISSVCLLKAKRRSLKIWDILQVTGLCACADDGRLCCAVIKCTHTHLYTCNPSGSLRACCILSVNPQTATWWNRTWTFLYTGNVYADSAAFLAPSDAAWSSKRAQEDPRCLSSFVTAYKNIFLTFSAQYSCQSEWFSWESCIMQKPTFL